MHPQSFLFSSVTQVRHRRYDPRFREPSLDTAELAEPLSDDDERKYNPIKAAKNYETTSVFYDPLLEKLINMLMYNGNKAAAREIVEGMLEEIKMIQVKKYNHAGSKQEQEAIECNPYLIFQQALENLKPALMIIPVRKGGTVYQVPMSCPPKRQQFKVFKWLVDLNRDRERKIRMSKKLAMDVVDAFHHEGKCMKKKIELLKLCEANRAFAHYRW
ncbi:hypothetical protein LOTGIDRAFT_110271 [Lottia gigantea]|uniref:Small ribosomal subunit protein uS7 domain-containing protein n=1 Tax=Lottia gigantea TaxID=225164 RepID=V4BCC7_LOTGI|nr:hypothetical protein LOTGIDRAFT_110271 [Lottia gigantea]ESP03782.1 hypothetical protein LOTGIDRAFT_110271 [Lottia gigantea]